MVPHLYFKISPKTQLYAIENSTAVPLLASQCCTMNAASSLNNAKSIQKCALMPSPKLNYFHA